MLASTNARNVYTGDGSTSIYAWGPWLVNAASDLRVAVLSNASPQVLTVLTLGVDFTIQFPVLSIGNSGGGNIVLSGTGFLAPTSGQLPNGWGIIIRRSVTFGQPSVLGDQEGSQASQIESMIDYLAMQTLQLKDAMTRTIQTPIDDYAAPTQNLPVASLRANGVFGFDASGNPMVVGGTIPPVSVTPFWVTILQISTAALSRIGLGFNGPGGTVQTANIDPAGLGSAAYAAGSILTAAIGALQVTAAKIANATITYAQIAANTILASNLDPTVGIFQPGDVKETFTNASQTGWLACNGSAVSRSTYATLYAAIGDAYGNGNGTTTFNVPDLRGRSLRGVSAPNAAGSGSVSLNHATFTAHGFSPGMRVQKSSGTLTGLSASVNYWVIVVDANTLKFSSARALAIAGTDDIAISGSNSAVLKQWEDVGAASRVAGAPGGNTGAALASYEDEDVAPHLHTIPIQTTPVPVGSGAPTDLYVAGSGGVTDSQGTETRMRNVAVNYLIKT